jgi:hypothetical protein
MDLKSENQVRKWVGPPDATKITGGPVPLHQNAGRGSAASPVSGATCHRSNAWENSQRNVGLNVTFKPYCTRISEQSPVNPQEDDSGVTE